MKLGPFSRFQFHQEGKRWVAICDELGTSTFGRSLREAERKLQDAVLLHLNTLDDVGETERFFKENKITFQETKPRGEVPFCVPTHPEVFVRPHIQRIRELTAA